MDTRTLMKVVSAVETHEQITVETTGARYVFHKTGSQGRIECRQLINKDRSVGEAIISIPFDRLCLEAVDDEKCILHTIPYNLSCQFLRIEIHRDSMMEFTSTGGYRLTYKTEFDPAYHVVKSGNVLSVDDIGGFGMYPYKGFEDVEIISDNRHQISYEYKMGQWNRFMLSVFPPRPYQLEQSFTERLYLSFSVTYGNNMAANPYPSNDEIEKASKYTNILWLFETMWKGKYAKTGKVLENEADVYADASYANYNYIPANEAELERVVKKAHSLNMRVLPYVSPFFSLAKGSDYINKIKGLLDKYQFDGVYLDGVSIDMWDGYELIRNLRQTVQDGIIFWHCTIDPLGKNIFCPFIDTYVDYTLRAEHIHDFDNRYMRYVISGINTGNAIGYTFYRGSPVDQFNTFIDRTLQNGARLYLDGLDKASSPYAEGILQRYFPRLDEQMKRGCKLE